MEITKRERTILIGMGIKRQTVYNWQHDKSLPTPMYQRLIANRPELSHLTFRMKQAVSAAKAIKDKDEGAA